MQTPLTIPKIRNLLHMSRREFSIISGISRNRQENCELKQEQGCKYSPDDLLKAKAAAVKHLKEIILILLQ